MRTVIRVVVHRCQGVHLPTEGSLPSPYVEVTAFGVTKRTVKFDHQTMCYFNSVFIFESNEENIELFEDIRVRVKHSTILGKICGFVDDLVLGDISIGCMKVYLLERHTVRNRWFPVNTSTSPKARGYIELSVGVYGANDVMPLRRSMESVSIVGPRLSSRLVSTSELIAAMAAAETNTFTLNVTLIQSSSIEPAINTITRMPYWNYDIMLSFNGLQYTLEKAEVANVTWSRSVGFPCIMPCWDNRVAIRVRHHGQLLDRLSGGTPVGETYFFIDNIQIEAMQPTWFYLYRNHAQQPTNDKIDAFYAGRLLIAANVKRRPQEKGNQVESRHVVDSVALPPYVGGKLHLNVNMICFENVAPLSGSAVEVHFALRETKLVAREHGEVRNFGTHFAKGGKVPRENVTIGDQDHVFGYVWIRTAEDASDIWSHSYFHIPATELDSQPHWYELISMDKNKSMEGVILASGRVAQAGSTETETVDLTWKSYVLRAYIYGAVNIPMKQGRGTKICVNLGDAILETEVSYGSLHPVFEFTKTHEVLLTEDASYRPSLLLSIMQEKDPHSKEDTRAGNRPGIRNKWEVVASLRLTQSKAEGGLPQSWYQEYEELTWMTARMRTGKDAKTHILCGFDLFEADNFVPATPWAAKEKISVPLCIVGCRLTEPVGADARISLAHASKAPKPVKLKNMASGSSSSFNFLEICTAECRIPQFSNAVDHIEVTLWTKDTKGERILGVASILLNGYYDVDKSTRECIRGQFSSTIPTPSLQKDERSSSAKLKRSKGTSYQLLRGTSSGTLDVGNDLAGTNELREHWMELLTNEWKGKTVASDVDSMNFRSSPMDTVDEMCVLNKNDVVSAPADSAIEQDSVSQFSWRRIGRSAGRRQIEMSLEEFYTANAQQGGRMFPMDEVPIWSVGAKDEMVGTLLFMMPRISAKANYATNMEELTATLEKLRQEYKPRGARVILHIIQGTGLVPDSGVGDPHTYLRAHLGGHTIDDRRKRIGCDPMYSSRMVFDHCKFPNDATLKVEVVEKPNEWCGFVGIENETVVGTTLINLEQRWLHKWFRRMMDAPKETLVPVEMRNLSGVGVSKGYISMWVEILTDEQRPVGHMPNPEARYFSVRLAIHDVSKIAFIDKLEANKETLDCQIEAKMTGNDKVAVSKSTDIHRGVNQKDMKATFNWRLLFRAPWPIMDPTLQIILWDARTVGGVIPIGREPLAECALNLKFDLKDAAEKNQSVLLALDTLQMTRPRECGKVRALLQCEVAIVPEEIADAVGEGREEPNRDPYLDPLDPHLQLGRPDLIAEVLGTAQKIGSSTLFWLKWGTMVYILVWIGGAVASGVVTMILVSQLSS